MVFKPCRYECNTSVEVRDTPEGWRPFEESGKMHDCPKSPYNQKKLQGEAYRTPKTSSLDDVQQRILYLLEELNKKVDSIISGRSFVDLDPEEQEV